MPFYALVRDAAATNADPCEHIAITTHVADCDQYASQGQVPTGQPTRFQATGLGDAVAVNEYILLLSGVDSGRYRKVLSRVNANTIEMKSAWPNLAEATPVDFAIGVRQKTINYEISGDGLWNPIDIETIIGADYVMLQAQARSISASPSGTRDQRINKIDDSAVLLRIL